MNFIKRIFNFFYYDRNKKKYNKCVNMIKILPKIDYEIENTIVCRSHLDIKEVTYKNKTKYVLFNINEDVIWSYTVHKDNYYKVYFIALKLFNENI